MSAMVSQITGVSVVCSTVCWGTDQRKYQSYASVAFVRGIHRSPVDSPHKGPVTRKMFPFDDVLVICYMNRTDDTVTLLKWFIYHAMYIQSIVYMQLYWFRFRLTVVSWWRHDIEAIPARRPLCEGTGHQWSLLTKNTNAKLWYFLYYQKLLNKHWSCRWFETPRGSSLQCHVKG